MISIVIAILVIKCKRAKLQKALEAATMESTTTMDETPFTTPGTQLIL